VVNRAYQFTFKRDEEGKVSPKGAYPEATLEKTSFKFPEQAQFSFGVASVLPIGASEPVGKRIDMLDYTGKNVLAPLLKGLSLAGLTELRDHPSHLGACNHVVVDH